LKKIILFIALFIASISVFAQNGPVFGMKAGLNLSKLTTTAGALSSSKFLPGYNFGGVLDVRLDSNLFFQPGILISSKGGDNEYALGNFVGTAKIRLNYIEVPVNFLYHMAAGVGKVFLGGGPYLAYGFSSNSDLTGDGNASGQNQFGDGTFGLKRLDAGLNFMAGYQLKQGFAIDVNYGLGLANLSNGNNTSNTKNSVVGISLGYFFK